ncbi:MAG: flagellar filament capping protein FliD, partial [Planctomycetota bacterium]
SVAGTSITTGQLLAGTNSVLTSSLNGGAGLTQTAITFDDRSGAGSVNLTLSAADISGSLSDLVEKLNTDLAAAGQGVTISVNESGRGLIATDTTGGSGALVITGALAAELGLDTGAGGVTQNTVEGTSLQKAYVGLQTRVSDFNNGQGVGLGTFRITDASGGVEEIEINSSHENLADIINLINSRPNIDVTAAINDNGDGIVITDTSGATGSNKQLLIEDVSGTVASNLRIAGTHTESAGSIKVNGSLETTVTFDADDTLDEAVQKINDSGAGISATVINDGSPGTPYRINFTSRNSGESGRVLIDTGGFDLQLRTLSEGQDAVTFFGADDPADAILITSSSNTLDDVISGVTIDLKQTSTAPVTLTVGTDTASIESAVSRFVDTFNTVLSTIDQYDFFDEESEDKGILFGDYTTQSIKRQLYSTVQSPGVLLDGQFQFLFQAGVKIGEDARLEFDSQQFRETLEQDFDAIEALFSERQLLPNEPIEVIPGTGITTPDTQDDFGRLGVPARLSLLIESFTDSISGSLTGRRNTIDTQIQDQNDRIARLDLQLENKRQRYQAQFIAMERAIGELQNQAGALNSLGQAG